MAEPGTIVIVGGGLAGAKAAETLRSEGFDGRVVVVAQEPRLPYERPPLSKGYLGGASAFADAQVHADDFYETHGIELLLGRAAGRLDAEAGHVELADGERLAYDRLLLATGAAPRALPVPGHDLRGVQALRTVADADRLREAIAAGGAVAIVGAGWIGCEVAATVRGLGADVTLIEHGAAPLERVLGAELGGFFARLHRAEGVELITHARVEAVEGTGSARGVRLADGRVVPADIVLVAVGVAPATGIAERAGLEIANGIVTDDRLRTSAPHVFAAGDVAAALHPGYGRHVRVEHWANAVEQGSAAARAMLGAGERFAAVPSFFSDQYDVGLEYWGLHGPQDRVVTRGSLDERRFQAVWLDERGSATAAMHVNDWDAGEPLKRLVEERAPLEATA